jgi:hypothetical protein
VRTERNETAETLEIKIRKRTKVADLMGLVQQLVPKVPAAEQPQVFQGRATPDSRNLQRSRSHETSSILVVLETARPRR